MANDAFYSTSAWLAARARVLMRDDHLCQRCARRGRILRAGKLIFANATARELTDYEKTEQARRMKELFRKLREEGHKPPLEVVIRDFFAH